MIMKSSMNDLMMHMIIVNMMKIVIMENIVMVDEDQACQPITRPGDQYDNEVQHECDDDDEYDYDEYDENDHHGKYCDGG